VAHPLQAIPGVGPSISKVLVELGYEKPADLCNSDPEEMYLRLCAQRPGEYIDRCVLYVFRCAVYFVTEKKHDPALLKWWNWKERG
jgi:hypothetical protein